MSRYTFILIVLCMLSVTVSAQQLRADAEEKHFGEMRPLDRRSLSFTLFNTGNETLRLGSPRPSCGCTATILDKSELAPGDSAHISVEFHAAPGMVGDVSKSVSIYGRFGDEERRLTILRFRATIVADVKFEPAGLRFDAAIGDTVRLEVLLHSNSANTVRLAQPTAAITEYVDTTAGNVYHVERVQARPFTALRLGLEKETLEPGESTRMLITLYPTEKGQVNGSVQLPLHDTVIRVPVIGSVLRQRE